MSQITLSQHIQLSAEQIDELERLSALGYTYADMALYFNFDEKIFIANAEFKESTINRHIRRGAMMSIAREQQAILTAAEGGNITASQELGKIRRDRGFEISKLDVFGGFQKVRDFEKLQNYIDGGCKDDLSNEESIWIEALSLMNSMDRKHGRRTTIAFFTKAPFNLTYSRASDMYDESQNLFYIDRNVEKKALRNKKAEQIEEAAAVVLQTAKNSKDFEVYGNLQMQAAKLRELDKVDPEPINTELYLKPVRMFSLDPTQVGIPSINRSELNAQIEALEIPEKDKTRLRQDAMIEQIILEDKLNELQEESKSR
ncbi:MAG: hypothetical protein H7296_07470 [Bacteroidia bacterium]|nr:hypothetical protein [Bacteroidia bacterium]